MKKALTIFAMSLFLAFCGTAFAQNGLYKKESSTAQVKNIVCSVFKEHCSEALKVVQCESRFDTGAQNGQYLGLFQMGYWERKTYGHGPGAYAQTRAAYRYFVASGKDWSPWECKPWW